MNESKHKTKKHSKNDETKEEKINTHEVEVESSKSENTDENYKDLLLRVQAEFDNYKKRSLKEKDDFLKYANFDILKSLLPIVDGFERAMAVEADSNAKAFLDGFEMVRGQLKELLARFGVTEIEALGQVFNPNLHQAIQSEESSEVSEETICEVYQKGYLLKDKILRLAMVKVCKPKGN